MLPRVENRTTSNLCPATKHVLQTMFPDHMRLVVKHDFSELGYSGSWVYLIHPFKKHRGHELPVVVKVASISLIQKEWQAYQYHMRNNWLAIADLRDKPVFLEQEKLAGLCYQLIGGNVFQPQSLREYCLDSEVSADDVRFVLKQRLFQMIKRRVIHPSTIEFDYPLQPIYDMVLPVNLLLLPEAIPSGETYTRITPSQLPDAPLEEGTYVRLEGFIVTKVDLRDQSVTLNLPTERFLSRYRVRIQSVEGLEVSGFQDVLHHFEGVVVETAESRFAAEVAKIEINDPTSPTITLSDGRQESNPLLMMPKILAKTRHLKFNIIHGDLNLENVLVDPEVRDISLIDFSEGRHGYVLHDLLHLEMEVVAKLLPNAFSNAHLPVEYVFEFYEALHHVTSNSNDLPRIESFPDPLKKPFMILKEIRQMAREGLYDRQDMNEYYEGLLLYLLGAVRFVNLRKNKKEENELNPKQLVFYAATAVNKLILEPPRPDLPQSRRTIQMGLDSPLSGQVLAHKSSTFSFLLLNLRHELKQAGWLIYLITFIFAFILVMYLFSSPSHIECQDQTLANWVTCLKQ